MVDERRIPQRRRRANNADRVMDDVYYGTEKSKDAGNVLLDSGNLMSALKESTEDGKKKLEGLYMPGGQRIDGAVECNERLDGAVKNKEALQEVRLQRVARTQRAKDIKRAKRAARAGKTEEEWFDELAGRKAEKILEGSTEHEQLMYKDLFNFFDVDKDRTWGSIEFAQRMTDIGFATSVEDASNLLYFAGVRDVDRISYNDFLQLMPKLKAYRAIIEKDVMFVFRTYDPGTGWISVKAAKQVLHDLAGPGVLENKEVSRMVKRMDRLKDGKITFDFFIRGMFDGSPPLVQYEKPQRMNPALQMILNIFGCGKKPIVRRQREDDEMQPNM